MHFQWWIPRRCKVDAWRGGWVRLNASANIINFINFRCDFSPFFAFSPATPNESDSAEWNSTEKMLTTLLFTFRLSQRNRKDLCKRWFEKCASLLCRDKFLNRKSVQPRKVGRDTQMSSLNLFRVLCLCDTREEISNREYHEMDRD